MQRKESKLASKITGEALLWTAFGAVLVTAALRLVQMFTNIEANTGFFKATDWTVYTVYGVFAVSVILLFVLSAVSNRIPASRPVFRKSPGLVFAGFLLAVGLAMDASLCIVQLIRAFKGLSGEAVTAFLFTEGMFAVILRAICAVVACVYFVLVALSYASENATYCDYKLMALAPLFWALFRMVSRFMTKISFLEVSELIFELVLLAFMSLFFLSFARVSSQVGQKGEMKKVVRYGMIAGFCALFIALTRLVCTIGGRAELVADGFPFSVADLGFGVFALLYVYEHMRYGRPASEDDELDDESQSKKAEGKTEKEEKTLENA